MKIWFGFQKGINLGGWFSQCMYSREHFLTFIQEKDFAKLKTWGVDHVRLPIDYNLIETEDGTCIDEGFDFIQRAYTWCRKYDLNLVLDLHKTAGFSFDQGEKQNGFFERKDYQERFYRLWEELAARFGSENGHIAFELLNEVTDMSFMKLWCEISTECIRRIRRHAPDLDILIGGYWNNSVASVKDLPMPYDEHVIYNFHCYEPLIFTHQGAYWMEGMPTDYRMSLIHTGKEYYKRNQELQSSWNDIMRFFVEGEETFGEHFFEVLFQEAVNIAEERNTTLYCGEYGVIDNAEPEDVLKWYQMIHKVFHKYGIGHCAWSYKNMNFGLSDLHYKTVVEDIMKSM